MWHGEVLTLPIQDMRVTGNRVNRKGTLFFFELVRALWNLPPEVTTGASSVDEKLVKYLRQRPIEGYYLKKSCQACVTHKLDQLECGKAPRGRTFALVLFFLGQLLLITAVERKLGWVDLWSELAELFSWECGQLCDRH